MALICYQCKVCQKKQFAFSGEESRVDLKCSDGHCVMVRMPPNPTTVHATNTYMSEPQLDSIDTLYELDRVLNIEAEEERGIKALNEHRKNN